METNGAPIQSTAEQVLAAAQPEAVEETQPEAVEETPEPPKPRRLSWEEALKRVPPDAAALMKEMRGDYTKKTQELADLRREVLRERKALLSGRPKQSAEPLPDYDPFNEDSINARIEAEVAKRLEAVLQPMQAEYEAIAAEEAYTGFLAEHPDLKEDTALRSEVQAILEANESVGLETAYWAAKGKQARYRAANQAKAEAAQREAAKQAATTATAPPRRGSSAVKAPTGSALRKMSAADILAQAQAMVARRG